MQAEAASAPAGIRAERSSVVAALRQAAAATGSDFHYLLGTAMRESGLRPDASAGTSSATGLFQFIDQTWLGLVKEHGARYGLGQYAAAITEGSDGRFRADAGQKASILELRKNPQVAALMAGEHAKSTQGQMKAALGREVYGGELYAAHFLGPDAACKLIRQCETNPGASAAALFPQAAGANRTVFYRADGTPKSVREVYDWALRQPGQSGTVRVAQLPDITPSDTTPAAPRLPTALETVTAAQDAQIQMLLASVMNWQPRGGNNMFAALLGMNDESGPRTAPLSFNPGLLSLFAEAKKDAAS
ncbi:MAG: hypothetical protein BGN82_05420 [Alphaproteobacteria bacterium 65-7]|nr:MAG: hypothetical protein BGN82_05420 [Alphaproteobacteria bacterium 65-7]